MWSFQTRNATHLAAACCMIFAVTHTVGDDDPQANRSRPISESQQVVTVTREDWGLLSDGTSQLILAIWGDGYIVWSEDRIRGGAPYLCGKIAPEQWRRLAHRFVNLGVLHKDCFRTLTMPVDGGFTQIMIRDGERQLTARSDHEPTAAQITASEIASTASGTEFRGSPTFVNFEKSEVIDRMLWSEIRL